MRHRWHRGLVVVALTLAGCATWQPPRGVDDATLRASALTQTGRDVRVSAALLDAPTSEAMFGEGVRDAGVQPVWIEVENRTPQPLWLLRTGADPDYFSPLEVAWGMHKRFSGAHNASVDEHVASRAFANPILPGATNAGVIFLNPQTGTVLLNVDLFGNKTLVTFSLFLWRDDKGTRTTAPMSFRYPESEITSYSDLAALRKALEQLPCCATNAEGGSGDPLNVVLVGTAADIASATVRRNYRRDLRDDDATQRLFGRAPDHVLRKQAQAGSPATWIRLWATPFRFEGKDVFVGHVGRPVGGRFVAASSSALVLHADIDEARNLVVQDMMYSGGLERLGFVTGGRATNTDGLRAVMFFAVRPRRLSDVEFLDWEPYLDRREAAARKEEPDASN